MDEPRVPSAIEPTGLLDGIQPGAVLVGVVVDIAATMIGSVLLLSLFATRGGVEPSEETLGELTASTDFLLASLIVGLLCTVVGGFVGARRASDAHVRHGAWIGVASALVGLAQYGMASDGASIPPFWFDVVGFGLIIPAGAAGGLLALVAARRGADEDGFDASGSA